MNTTKKRIEVYDTTLRDGAQAQGVSVSLKDKLEIAERLDFLGVDFIEGGYPLSNPKDEQFFEELRKRTFRHAKPAAFGMTRRKDTAAEADAGMQTLLRCEAPVVTLVGKSWDLHVREVLRVSNDENLAMIADSIAFLARSGRETIFDAEHFFDGYKADPDYALRTLQAAHDAGAGRLVLCDTNGGSLPEEIARITAAVRGALGDAVIGIHGHNDSGLAVANSLAAVTAGATHVQGTINGVGERCGNVDLIALAANLAFKAGCDVLRPGSLEHLTEVSRHIGELMNVGVVESQPFVGVNAFAHKGGMHVHAVGRNPQTYEHIPPEVVGNHRRILVSELSGVSNIAATVDSKFEIGDDKAAQQRVLRRVMDLEAEGYQFEAAEASMEMIVRNWYRPLWALDHYRCVILKRDGEPANTEAIVKLTVDGQARHFVAEGDGPVDSLMGALRRALAEHYPRVRDLHLLDYRVRVVNTAAETAARVRVAIDWRDAATENCFGSVGVNENIIDASWLALIDAIEYKLLGALES
jgi:2-isopropylmalate synthase